MLRIFLPGALVQQQLELCIGVPKFSQLHRATRWPSAYLYSSASPFEREENSLAQTQPRESHAKNAPSLRGRILSSSHDRSHFAVPTVDTYSGILAYHRTRRMSAILHNIHLGQWQHPSVENYQPCDPSIALTLSHFPLLSLGHQYVFHSLFLFHVPHWCWCVFPEPSDPETGTIRTFHQGISHP